MKSRTANIVYALVTLGINCWVALRVIPVAKPFFLPGMHIPHFTRLVLDFGPAVLVVSSLLSACVTVMSGFKPILRRMFEPVAILVLLMGLSAVGSLFLPRWKCGDIINPSAREPVPAAVVESQPDVDVP